MKTTRALLTLLAATVPLFTQAQVGTTSRLCAVKSTGQLFSRSLCRSSEVDVTPRAALAATTPTPTTTTTTTVAGFVPNKCRGVSVQNGASGGSAEAALQCDSSTEFMMTWGFNVDGANRTTAPALRNAELAFNAQTTLPIGIDIETYSSNTSFYNLTLQATCCKK